MFSYFYKIVLSLLVLGYSMMPAQSQIDTAMTAQLQTAVRGFQERYHSLSVVLMIVHKDDVIFSDASGYTDLEKKIPATVNSKYQIQSITKMFTATLTMKLWEMGILQLDGDVRKFVPEFTGANRNGRPTATTFMELATHASGLPRNSQADIGFAKEVETWMLTKKMNGAIEAATKSEFLRSLRSVTREYPEYEFMNQDARQYSNLGYALLGVALERAAKRNYEDAVMNIICKPLNLYNTGFGTVSERNHVIANGYDYNEHTHQFLKTPDFHANAVSPAAGMYSTAKDLAKFISAQFSNKDRVISEKTIRMMESLGIGWQRSYPYLKHEGAMIGFRSEIVLHPRLQVGWVILTNTTNFEFNRFNEYIASLVLPLFANSPLTDLNQYTGTYSVEGGGENIKIYMKDGKLYSTYLEHILPREPLYVSGNNTLKAKGSNGHEISYNFLTDGNGKISVLNLSQLMWVKQ